MSMNVNARAIISDILWEIYENGEYTHIVLSEALEKYQYLPNVERSFISRTVLGTVERTITIDYIIDCFSKVKVSKMKPFIRNLMRMSTYQIVYMEGVKDYAVCNEAVKLASRRGFSNLKGFVNGVLRTIIREKDGITFPETDTVKKLSVRYSTPEWIVKKWIDAYSEEEAEKILKAQFTDRALTIRCNTVKTDTASLTEKLRNRGIDVTESTLFKEALHIKNYDYLNAVPEFTEGLFSVQDASSMLVCRIAAPVNGNYVIDVCAAPGGKCLHIAEMLGGTGCVDARDVSEHKTELINRNIGRLGISNIKTSVMDAMITDEASVRKADIVIADLPCSGLGILNKKPDIKYRASEEKCRELVKIQKKILAVCSQYVKDGGILVYSTCTLNPEENTGIAEWFAEEYGYAPADIEERVPEALRKYIIRKGCIEIHPDKDSDLDGFFIAAFERRGKKN